MDSRAGAEPFEIDVLGLGAVAVDDVVYVESYPRPDEKAPVSSRARYMGGLTATALVTAARLGSRAAYAGVLGDDELSLYVIDALTKHGVDLRHLVSQSDARPIHSTIIVSRQQSTRNIFFDRQGVVGAHPMLPEPDVVKQSHVLLIDNFGVQGMVRAAHIARTAGVPVVADLEDDGSALFEELLSLANHVIMSRSFAQRLTRASDPASAVKQLWKPDRAAVIVTGGANGVWYLVDDDPDTVHYQPAFRIHAVDSTGCGDVFHGAYAASLAHGYGITDRILVASAAAAIKATKSGGPAGIPDWLQIERLLKQSDIRLDAHYCNHSR